MLSRRWIGGWRVRAILALVLVALVAAGCGAAGAPARLDGNPTGDGAGAPKPGTGGDLVPGEADGGSGGSGGGEQVKYLAGQADLLIIKTGTITLQVAGIDAALSGATERITALGGYASGSERSGDGDTAQATITYRVPAARWDEALAALRGLATKVLGERTSTEDVTSRVVDLGARITNLQATERALQAIMDRATEIKDVLAVQAELTKVRGEIEQLSAEKAHLEQQAALSTLTVTFALKPNAVQTSQERFDPGSEADRAAASLMGVLQGLATAGIWFAIVWLPILLVIAVIALIGLLVARRLRRRGGAQPGLPVAGDA